MSVIKSYSGCIQEKHRNLTEIYFLWKIPRFLASKSAGYEIVSPPLKWLGTTWRLKVYPNGNLPSAGEEYVELCLLSTCLPQKSVRFTFGIQKVNKTELVTVRNIKFGNRGHLRYTVPILQRSQLLLCMPELISSGALTVTCIIRIEDVNLCGENPSTNLGCVGEIRETLRQDVGISFEWQIPKIFSLPSEIGDYYFSPEVEFLDTKWHFRIYPNGHPSNVTEGWMGLDVRKSDFNNCKKPVRLTLAIKDAGKEEKVIYQNEVIAEYCRLWSGDKFIQQSQLLMPKYQLSCMLTVSCTLRTDEMVPAGDVSTEENAGPSSSETFAFIRENFRTSNEIGFEWRIPKFSSLSGTGERHSSPVVEFLNTSWRFEIYPFPLTTKPFDGWVGIEVWKMDWSGSQKSVLLTIGIKKADSTEDVIFRRQKFSKHRHHWCTTKFLRKDELMRRKHYIFPSDLLTIVCTMREDDSTPVLWGIIKLPQEPDVFIRERECNFHKEVEWDFPFEKTMSPDFMIGSQTYWLKWKDDTSQNMYLNLYSVGPPIGLPENALWWAGLKRPDGTYLYSNTCGVLNMVETGSVWVQKRLYKVKMTDLRPELTGGRTTIFLRINVERTPKGKEACSHGAAEFCGWEDYSGYLKHRASCAYHEQVEWEVTDRSDLDYELGLRSPEFSFRTEAFKIKLSYSRDRSEHFLNLYSRSTAVRGSFPAGRWWIAMKYGDGTYNVRNHKGELNAEDECDIWTLRSSFKFDRSDYKENLSNVVFRYNSKEEPPSRFVCSHDKFKMPLKATGSIQEARSLAYKQIEWSLVYKLTAKGVESAISPAFLMGGQHYVLQFTHDWKNSQCVIMCVYRMGRHDGNTPGFLRLWTGLRRRNGTYSYNNGRGATDLQGNCEIWTQVLFHRFSVEELEKSLLSPDCPLNIFLRLSEDLTTESDNNELDFILPDSKRLCSGHDDKVVFQVKGMEFKISKAVLQTRVPVMDAMFLHDMVEKRTGVVSIEDCEPATFGQFLHYTCYGFLRETEYNAIDLYAVADKYLLEDLKVECVQTIRENISVRNFCESFTFAVTYGEDDLLEQVTDFFSKNRESIITDDSWFKLCEDNHAMVCNLLIV